MVDDTLLGDLFKLDVGAKKLTTRSKSNQTVNKPAKKSSSGEVKPRKRADKESMMNSGLNATFDGLKKLSIKQKMEIIGFASRYF